MNVRFASSMRQSTGPGLLEGSATIFKSDGAVPRQCALSQAEVTGRGQGREGRWGLAPLRPYRPLPLDVPQAPERAGGLPPSATPRAVATVATVGNFQFAVGLHRFRQFRTASS